MLKKILDDLSSLGLAAILCFSLIYAVTSTLGLNIPVYAIILTIVALLVLFKIIFLSRLSMLISGLITAVLLIYFTLQISFNTGLTPIIEFVYNYFSWLYDLIEYGTLLDVLYSHITFLALCILSTVYYFIFSYKKYLFLMVVIPGVIVFSVQSAFNFIVTFLPFYVFLFALILCYFKHIYKRKLKSPGNDYLGNASFLLWVIPVAAAVVFIAAILHTNNKPLEWKWLDTRVNTVYNYFYKKFDYVEFDYFSVANSGFGDKNNVLGGRVKLNNTLVLTVETDRNVYLKGTSYDEYTGRSWVDTGEEKVPYEPDNKFYINDTPFINLSGILAGMLMSGSPDYFSEFFNKEEVKIVYQNIKTKSLFLPNNLTGFNIVGKDQKLMMSLLDDSFVSEKRLGSGFAYTANFLTPKRASEDFIDTLRESKQGALNRIAANRNLSENSLVKIFTQHSKDIYSKYLQIPDTVPQRVYDLASSLTVQNGNNYDKVKALEDYLSTTFPYNLDVRSTPRNRDFVDYFLFDQKEGYCTYFASALTIMARCLGIPARYVEGYILPPKPSAKNPHLYYVTNNQAHAWTEVYFEGYGWLPFEATSPFRSSFYTNPENTAVYSSNLTTDPQYTDYMEMMKKYSDGNEITGLPIGDVETKKSPYLLYTVLAAGAIILLILSVFLFHSVRTKMKLYKIINMTPKESVLRLYKYFVSVLTYAGYGIQAGETPFQYSERVDRYLYFRPVKFRDITDIFIKSRYSTNAVTDKEKQILTDFIPKLFAESKSNMGKIKYFLYKRALGKF